MKKKREQKRETDQRALWLSAMVEVLRGGAVAFGGALLMLVAAAALISAGVVDDAQMDSAVAAACLAGALAGGLVAVVRGKGRPLLLGLGVGAVLFLLLLTAGVLLYDAVDLEHAGLSAACACLCGGALAGILGRRKKKRRK